ncbi:MAG: hypothetical protein ICV59_04735 [Thermoleophilia bacterium]|nr:hypothetical protein [Thermoleophilia bacterium]
MPTNRAAFEEIWQAVCIQPAPDDGEREELARIAQTLRVAPASDVEERAWALNTLSVALATLGHPSEALGVLRACVRLEPSDEARIAALACAALIRAEQGEHDDAARLARIVGGASGDPRMLSALGTALARRALEADDEELGEAASECLRWADLETAFAAD